MKESGINRQSCAPLIGAASGEEGGEKRREGEGTGGGVVEVRAVASNFMYEAALNVRSTEALLAAHHSTPGRSSRPCVHPARPPTHLPAVSGFADLPFTLR